MTFEETIEPKGVEEHYDDLKGSTTPLTLNNTYNLQLLRHDEIVVISAQRILDEFLLSIASISKNKISCRSTLTVSELYHNESSLIKSSCCEESPINSSCYDESSVSNSCYDESPISDISNLCCDESPISDSCYDESPISDSCYDESSISDSCYDESSISDSCYDESPVSDSCCDESSISDSYCDESSVIKSCYEESFVNKMCYDESPVCDLCCKVSAISDSWRQILCHNFCCNESPVNEEPKLAKKGLLEDIMLLIEKINSKLMALEHPLAEDTCNTDRFSGINFSTSDTRGWNPYSFNDPISTIIDDSDYSTVDDGSSSTMWYSFIIKNSCEDDYFLFSEDEKMSSCASSSNGGSTKIRVERVCLYGDSNDSDDYCDSESFSNGSGCSNNNNDFQYFNQNYGHDARGGRNSQERREEEESFQMEGDENNVLNRIAIDDTFNELGTLQQRVQREGPQLADDTDISYSPDVPLLTKGLGEFDDRERDKEVINDIATPTDDIADDMISHDTSCTPPNPVKQVFYNRENSQWILPYLPKVPCGSDDDYLTTLHTTSSPAINGEWICCQYSIVVVKQKAE